MKKIFIIFSILALFFTKLAYSKVIDVEVNGLVCEFCAVTIERGFKKEYQIVQKVDINLDSKKIFIHLDEGSDISDAKIIDIITNNGYNVVKITR